MSGGFQPAEMRGGLQAAGLRFALVVSRFNSFITERLLDGAREALAQAGAAAEQLEVVRVPGSFEIPLAAKKLAQTGKYDVIIAIGCVLRGETAHFDYVASEVARGVQLAQMDTGVPVIFCVLTCDTLEQAIDRAGLKGGNKGREAGLAALEMAQLSRKLRAVRRLHGRRPARGRGNAANMAQRHKSREYALQMLFQWEIGHQDPQRIEEGFWRMARADKNVRALANQLFESSVEGSAEFDALAAQHAHNWRAERMAVIDRMILRLAACELRGGKTPAKVVLNEAVELAKTFSSQEGASFVNGVLDGILKARPKK